MKVKYMKPEKKVPVKYVLMQDKPKKVKVNVQPIGNRPRRNDCFWR